MENLTLETLPKAFTALSQEVNEIKKLLIEKQGQQQDIQDLWFDLNELCNYLPDKPAKATVYGWVHSENIPCHKGGKKLRFLKSEIDAWLKQGRKKTQSEIAEEAKQYVKNKKG
jgi:excisionase family DNA binding protein